LLSSQNSITSHATKAEEEDDEDEEEAGYRP